jgi:O-antigen/teichoic acid export membrane protein
MLKRLAHAFIAMSFGQLLAIISNFLLVPIFLRVWSPGAYGEWLTMYALVAYLGNLDMGMQSYVLNRLTQAFARGDIAEYRRQQHSAMAFYLILVTFGTFGISAVALWAPLTRWFNLVNTSREVAALVIVLLGAQVLWALPGWVVFSVYRTTGQVATSQWITNTYRLAGMGFTIAALLIWKSPSGVAATQLGVWLLSLLVILWDVHRRYPDLLPGVAGATFSVIKQQMRPSVLFGLITLGVAVGFQGANLLVAGVLGGAAVALFVTTRTLVNSIKQIVGLFTNAIWTDITRMEALGEQARLRLALRLTIALSACGCIAVAAPLWFEGGSVISVWTRGKLVPDVLLLRFLLAYVVLQAPWSAAAVFGMSTNRHKNLAGSYLVANVAGLAAAALLIRYIGLVGVPVGLICGDAIACYHFVLADACKITTEPYGRFAARLWLAMGVLAAMSLLATWYVHQLTKIPMMARWGLSGAVSIAVVGAGMWFGWLLPGDRKALGAKVKYGWERFCTRIA